MNVDRFKASNIASEARQSKADSNVNIMPNKLDSETAKIHVHNEMMSCTISISKDKVRGRVGKVKEAVGVTNNESSRVELNELRGVPHGSQQALMVALLEELERKRGLFVQGPELWVCHHLGVSLSSQVEVIVGVLVTQKRMDDEPNKRNRDKSNSRIKNNGRASMSSEPQSLYEVEAARL
jgi:hypothetical protein